MKYLVRNHPGIMLTISVIVGAIISGNAHNTTQGIIGIMVVGVTMMMILHEHY